MGEDADVLRFLAVEPLDLSEEDWGHEPEELSFNESSFNVSSFQ